MARVVITVGCVLVLAGTRAGSARADFPWAPGGEPGDPTTYRLAPTVVPNDLSGDGNEPKFAATPEPGSGNPLFDAQNLLVRNDPRELCGVRGASVVDRKAANDLVPPGCAPGPVRTGWETSTGRPDVVIAVLDSGIEWNNLDAMLELRRKVRLNRGELPKPRTGRARALDPAADCSAYRAGSYDANDDSVFDVLDYACDPRVSADPALGVGPRYPDGHPEAGGQPVLEPQDLLIAFSDRRDDDSNGYRDDIAGWDFLDDDNDPYDDVQYGHGTGEASDSSAEADNAVTVGSARLAGSTGSCPNCTFIPLRVGDSFVADSGRFGQAAIYAVDNGALVVQEALGTLNNTGLGRAAVNYAYRHGVAVMASAADEAAQHHNYPSSLPHTIVVNSARRYDQTFTPQPRSYLQFNGCTNFSSKIALSIPSTSCSSNAVGLAAGYAGVVYSAALNAHDAGRLAPHPTCRRVDGSRCVISANELRQLMASGRIGGRGQADDVNFASAAGGPEPSCSPTPGPGCTDPNLALQTLVNANRPVVSPLFTSRSYPARRGHDQFYGWGRINLGRAAVAADSGTLLPEVEINSPDWFEQVDPREEGLTVKGEVHARGAEYSCRIYAAPGSYPNDSQAPAGDFVEVPSPGACDGSPRTEPVDGSLGRIDISALRGRFPADAGSFDGPEPGQGAGQTSNGRPNSEPYGFVVKVVATTTGTSPRSGEDRRNLYLHHDQDLLPGFPRTLPSDGESSPLLIDLDGDNRNELVFATADGIVHAQRPDGSEARGWPVRGDRLPLHTGGRGFASRAIARGFGGSFLASVAAGDMDRDGSPEVVAADFEGKVYAWTSRGRLLWKREANPAYSGRPLKPFVNVRKGVTNRTQHGFIASPVLVDLDLHEPRRLEVVLAGMDRHVYAFNHDGSRVRGYPVLVVDRSKLGSIDPKTHAVRFDQDKLEDPLNQGAIVDTPAVGDLDDDGKPEIVVGTNEEYLPNRGNEGDLNAGAEGSASIALAAQIPDSPLSPANGRIYAIKGAGDPGEPADENSDVFLPGWPVAIARLLKELLPVVGEGITGAPVIGPRELDCGNSGGQGPKVGVIPDGGLGYVLNRDGSSCQGQSGGNDNSLQSDTGGGIDHPAFPALGHPAFGDFAGGVSFIAPATGLLRALDVAAPEYQTGGQDFLSAWDPESGQFRPGFPSRVNDLQFLTGPSVGDVDGQDGEEIVGGSASLDLQALAGDGQPVARWPKLTSDWTVANPVLGSFGSLDTDAGARRVVVSLTRSGFLFAYRTAAGACAPSSWPRFHHDNANSGYYDRDAVAPGVPMKARLAHGELLFRAPGDDGLCGRAERYEIAQSERRIRVGDFSPDRLAPDAPAPAEAGTEQSYTLPDGAEAHVAIRAVDEQGNPGRWVEVELGGGERVGPA